MSLSSEGASKGGDIPGIPEPGSIVAGKYRIEQKLGAGGMGVVLAARHIQLNQLVAIKFLHPETSTSGLTASRFLREARASAALKSEHVVRVFDVGALDSGAPYIVMEHLEGVSLTKIIRARAPLPVTTSVDLMLQACKGMEEAHALGIVHRDIKPGNMFLTLRPDGSTLLKVLDFGISKVSKLDDEAEPTLTASQVMLGSPKYFSPEQVTDAKNVDHRADVWALGLVLYYMLAGRRPFEGDTMSAVCVAVATETPPRLSDLRPDIPRELDVAVMSCLEKDRERRMQSASDLARAIAPFGSGGAVHEPLEDLDGVPARVLAMASRQPSQGSSPELSYVASTKMPIPEPRPSESQRNVALAMKASPSRMPVVWVQAAAAAVVVGGLVGVLLMRAEEPPPQQMGNVVPDAPASTAAPEAPAAQTDKAPAERSILVPGSAKPVTPTRPTASEPDLGSLLGANMLGTTQATLRLLDGMGSQQVIGVVPKGEVVMIKRVVGEWALVTYVDKGRAISGWTIRNLIQ